MSAVLFTDTLVANHWDQNADQWKKDVEAGLDVYERGGHVPHAQGVFYFIPATILKLFLGTRRG